jgi:hypothetical protein
MWWGYIKAVIRSYPALKRDYDALHEQSITANMSGMPGGGAVSRGTENIATRELPRPKQAEYDAVRKAIAVTEQMRTGTDRLRIIDMVFWKNSHTLQGAAMAASVSYDTAIDYHGDFIMMVAYFRDLVTFEEMKNHQKFALKSQKDVV